MRIRMFIPDLNFSIPDPGSKRSRIRIKEFKYLSHCSLKIILRENCHLYCLTSKTFGPSRRFLLSLFSPVDFYQFQSPALTKLWVGGVGEGVCSRLLVGAGGLQVCRHPRRGPVTQRLLLRTQGTVIFTIEFFLAVLRIRILICLFLGHPDPDSYLWLMDPDPAPDPSIIMQK